MSLDDRSTVIIALDKTQSPFVTTLQKLRLIAVFNDRVVYETGCRLSAQDAATVTWFGNQYESEGLKADHA